MVLARISSIAKPSASSIAGSITSLKDLVPKSRSATSPASTIPGTSAGMIPATGMMPFNPPGSVSSTSPGLQRTLAKHIRRGELRHRADARDRKYLAGLGADQNGSFAAHSEVRKFGDRRGEHRGHSRIHRVAAVVIDPHSGFGGVLAAGRDRAVRPANRLPQRMIVFASELTGAQADTYCCRERDRNNSCQHDVFRCFLRHRRAAIEAALPLL